jgi:hypothetical protein
MVFDTFKKWFAKNKYDETPSHKMEIINEELDQFEKEIQEYIQYSENREPHEKEVSQPEILAQGGGYAGSSLITPEEEKRISGEPPQET